MSGSTSTDDTYRSREDRPTFELTARFDDAVEPSEVTVYPSTSDNPTTEWLTIDAEYALSLEETV